MLPYPGPSITSPIHLCPLLSRIEGNQSLRLSSSPLHPSLETSGGSTPLNQSGDAEEGSKKCHRSLVHEELFPWRGTSAVPQVGLEPEVQQCLDLLDDWTTDPTYVVRKILLSPGCPDFSPDQWLNIVKGYAVDPAKVLGAHYSSDVDTKQSQDLDPRTCSRSLLECPSSPRASKLMETGLLHLERLSKQSLMPCQDKTQSMLPTKYIWLPSLHPSSPHSTLKSLTLTRPS